MDGAAEGGIMGLSEGSGVVGILLGVRDGVFVGVFEGIFEGRLVEGEDEGRGVVGVFEGLLGWLSVNGIGQTGQLNKKQSSH